MVANGKKYPDRRTVTLPTRKATDPVIISPAGRPSQGDTPQRVLR